MHLAGVELAPFLAPLLCGEEGEVLIFMIWSSLNNVSLSTCLHNTPSGGFLSPFCVPSPSILAMLCGTCVAKRFGKALNQCSVFSRTRSWFLLTLLRKSHQVGLIPFVFVLEQECVVRELVVHEGPMCWAPYLLGRLHFYIIHLRLVLSNLFCGLILHLYSPVTKNCCAIPS